MPDLGNSWRTSDDYYSSDWTNIIRVINDNNWSAAYAGPGRWSDPDILHVGRTIGGETMTDDEYRSHFAMWCIMAAPLIAGNDVTAMSESIRSILTASEIIAVDQDPAGVQGVPVQSTPGIGGNLEVWCKPLGFDGYTKAVALFNRSDVATNITAQWQSLSLYSDGVASVRDLWARQDLGGFSGSFTTNVRSHATVMLKITGVAPTLRVANAEQFLVFSWPLSASNYGIEKANSLVPNTAWTSVSGNLAVAGNSLYLTNPPPNRAGFYRLRKPSVQP
jgi:alpha-galactosidase